MSVSALADITGAATVIDGDTIKIHGQYGIDVHDAMPGHPSVTEPVE